MTVLSTEVHESRDFVKVRENSGLAITVIPAYGRMIWKMETVFAPCRTVIHIKVSSKTEQYQVRVIMYLPTGIPIMDRSKTGWLTEKAFLPGLKVLSMTENGKKTVVMEQAG